MTPFGFSTMPWRKPRTTATRRLRFLAAGPEHLDRSGHAPSAGLITLGFCDPAGPFLAVGIGELLERGLGRPVGVQRPGQLRWDLHRPRRLIEIDRDVDGVPGVDAGAIEDVLAEHHVRDAAVDGHPGAVRV